MIHTLYGRLALVFAVLTLACGGFGAWLFVDAAARHQQEVLQRLSRDLATHIAGHTDLVRDLQLNRPAVDELFHMLMVVNPGIEVYLLDRDGRVAAHVAPAGHVKRERVDLAPIRAFLGGRDLPVRGDDPRNADARKIFSAAPLKQGDVTVGYLYVVLAGEDYDRLAADVWTSRAVSAGAWLMGGMVLLTLAAGLTAFALITRRLRRLTATVRALEHDGLQPDAAAPAGGDEGEKDEIGKDEIGQLHQAFRHMAARIAEQMRELRGQDQLRREMVANISHDLRTPLTSLQGYLETLSLKGDNLSPADRARYLDVAVRQSRKVGRLAQELFELAKLECDLVQPQKEAFALPELVQDVLQKFELAARDKAVDLSAGIAAQLPPVLADLGMIERVLTNLLDNALRHTPDGGRVRVELSMAEGSTTESRVRVRVADSGSGIPPAQREHLFERPSPLRQGGRSGSGLGLLIVQRILNLHDSQIHLEAGPGAVFSFSLPRAR